MKEKLKKLWVNNWELILIIYSIGSLAFNIDGLIKNGSEIIYIFTAICNLLTIILILITNLKQNKL